MFIIEPIQYAKLWVNELKKDVFPSAKAYAVFTMYESQASEKYPSLRDRTEELVPAVKAIVGANSHVEVTLSGSELYRKYGFDAVGAQFAKTYKIIFA